MPQHFNTEAKQLIRNEWGRPLLQLLHDTIGRKLIYLGLPSENPEDVYAWIDILEEVYAFQCREYPKPSEETQSRAKVLELERKLRQLEEENKLAYSMVFDGYIEEVVLRGYDNNPQPITFGHEEVIAVYNLDFCNQITSPIIFQQEGELRTAYKFDVIKELLRYQSQVNQLPKKFVLFLTVHANFKDEHVTYLVQNHFSDYHNKIARLGKIETRSRLLKAYIYKVLRDAFEHYHFIPEFLPVIRYKGVNNHSLLHFTVVGTYQKNSPGGVLTFQRANKFLNQKFISISDKKFIPLTTQHLEEKSVKWNSVEFFKKTDTFKKIWDAKKNI